MTSEPSEPSESSPAQPPPRRHRGRRLAIEIGLGVILLLVVGFALWVWVTLGFVYSSGERTGYVTSLEQSGWLCKTWEGELAVTPAPGLPRQTFNFNIRSDSLAHALQLATGKEVSLSYDQHRGVPGDCFGETEYYIQSFRVEGVPPGNPG